MRFDTDLLLAATEIAGVTIACVAALLCLTRSSEGGRRWALALFFIALALSELSPVLGRLVVDMSPLQSEAAAMATFAANFFIAPLFLLHLRGLVQAAPVQHRGRDAARHFGLPALSALFALGVAVMLPTLRDAMQDARQFDDLPLAGQIIAVGYQSLLGALYLQWLIYVGLVVRLQTRHIARLEQHFASTEGLELRWVILLACVLGSYALYCLVAFGAELIGDRVAFGAQGDSLFVLVVMLVLVLWGLRPARPWPSTAHTLQDDPLGEVSKYRKSALSTEQAERIGLKLLHAMRHDRVYRDPNLTLAALSDHIGVSTNYVSQTLNAHIGQSFFEFVNGMRVEEAIPLVLNSDQTILAIAYEVGFNSRSAFYTAFKAKTGCTPSEFKKLRGLPQLALS